MSNLSNKNKRLFDLSGKRAVVTGAGRGIGRACALGLAEFGAHLGLVSRTESELKETADRIRAVGCRAEYVAMDLTRTTELPGLVNEFQERLGGIDILVNNAGLNIPKHAVDVSEEDWDRVMDINLKACFFLAQAVGRVMIEQGRGGRIINMSSQTGSVGLIKRAAYCASKGGLNLVTKVLALEWADHGILVNGVAPTFIITELSKGFLSDSKFKEYALSKNLLNRFGEPENVVGAVVYLASPAADLVTGTVLMVDAGWTAH